MRSFTLALFCTATLGALGCVDQPDDVDTEAVDLAAYPPPPQPFNRHSMAEALGAGADTATANPFAITLVGGTADRGVWYNEAFAAVTDSGGYVYQAGYDFIPPPISDYRRTVKKFSAGGTASWVFAQNVPGTSTPGNETFTSIVLGDSTAVFAASYGPNVNGTGGDDWSVVRINATNGGLVWQSTFGTGSDDAPSAIAYDVTTDLLYVGGTWGSGWQVKVINGTTGAVWYSFAPTWTIEAMALDPSVGGAAGVTLYIVGSGAIGAYDPSTGNPLWSWSLPFVSTGDTSVDVDLVSGYICAAGSGLNLVTTFSGQDGWVKRFMPNGTLQWTRTYGTGVGGEAFYGVAAKHGGGGCVAAGEIQTAANGTDMLTVDYSNGGVLLDDDTFDEGGLANPGWNVHIPATGAHAGKAIVTGRGWSINGGPNPQPKSYDALSRRLSL